MEKFFEDDPKGATPHAMNGFVCRHGFFFKTEREARCSSATHSRCTECNKPTFKSWLLCLDCQSKKQAEKYKGYETVPWDGVTPLYSIARDTYYWVEDDLICDLEDNDSDPMLVLCEAVYADCIEPTDHYADLLPEGRGLPSYVEDAFRVLNKTLEAKEEPLSWHPTMTATTYEID